MKAFYSIVKLVLNELAGDTMSIGIILSDPNGIRVKFSKHKKQHAKSLLSIDPSLVDYIEKEITNRATEYNEALQQRKGDIFEIASVFNSDYFSYLSRYSNGLLNFSAPSLFAAPVDEEKFNKLFAMFVDNTVDSTERQDAIKQFETQFYQRVNDRLISRIHDKVHTNQDIDSKIVPTLFTPFHMDCIGLNGVFVGAKSLPFTQTKETLHKTINTYISVIAHLTNSRNRGIPGNNFYIISDEPQQNTQEHHLWQQIYNDGGIIKLISSDESGQVAELIENNGAGKFLD